MSVQFIGVARYDATSCGVFSVARKRSNLPYQRKLCNHIALLFSLDPVTASSYWMQGFGTEEE
jgi:hypothetical protein